MALLDYERYCDEVCFQSEQLLDLLADADLSAAVPTCPDWTLAELGLHVGHNLRAVEAAVHGTSVEELSPASGAAVLRERLEQAATRFVSTMREVGPVASVRVWGLTQPSHAWVRRAAHDLVIHRADVAMARGAGFTIDADMAIDAIDELLEIVGGRYCLERPLLPPELRGVRESIHLHATDVDGEWFVELGTGGFVWRHKHGKATSAVRGRLSEVLLVTYRRLPLGSPRVEVLGRLAPLQRWLNEISLG